MQKNFDNVARNWKNRLFTRVWVYKTFKRKNSRIDFSSFYYYITKGDNNYEFRNKLV
jgi:hypothetical protein